MKLTAKLLKKIIREAVQGGVPGIGKFYDEKGMSLPVDYAKQGAEESGRSGKDIKAKDVSESILIEVKEIIADFVDQYYNNFISDVYEAEGGDNWADEYDGFDIIKGRIERLIDNTYYMNPSTLRSKILAAISMKMFNDRSLKPYAKVVRNRMRRMDRFFSSYDDLYNALANRKGRAPELEKLNIEKEVNEAIKEYADLVRAAKKLRLQPIENYKKYIRLANSKEEVAKIFQQLEDDLLELLSFMKAMTMRNVRYYNVGPPRRYVIDPEQSEFEDIVGFKYKDYRKTIEALDPKTGLKKPLEIVNEVERYVEQRIAGDVIAQAGAPEVQQKFMPEKFPMDEAMLHRIIMEELEEVYKGNRIIYAPDTEETKFDYSPEVGSYILPSKNPYDALDPRIKAVIPATADEETLRQAYELSKIDLPVEDFIEAVKLSPASSERNPYYKLHPSVQEKYPLTNPDGELIDDETLKKAYEEDLMIRKPPSSPEEEAQQIAQQKLDALRTPRSRARRAKYPLEDTSEDDFVQGVKLSNNPDKVIREPANELIDHIKKLRTWVRANIPRRIPHPEIEGEMIPNPEYHKYRKEINKMKIRLARLHDTNIDNVHQRDGARARQSQFFE